MKINRAFSTPIAIRRPTRATTLDASLAHIILAAEVRSASARRSNVGGWRSRDDLLDWQGPEISDFAEILRTAVEDIIRATVGTEAFTGYFRLKAWANVLRAGNYNTLHAHPESAWSGVYYVDAGDATEPDGLSGVLELIDPRPGAEMVPAPGWPFGRPVRIVPETGLMVLFPSWLYHFVHPYHGVRPRIAIAFNAPVNPGDPSA
jgi:uncharacterized protein (TIGR02466 family)